MHEQPSVLLLLVSIRRWAAHIKEDDAVDDNDGDDPNRAAATSAHQKGR